MPGKVEGLNEERLNSILKSKKLVLIDFWAKWCTPCMVLKPIFERMAEKYGDKVAFGSVDVDKNAELADRYKVRAIPTLIFFRDGKEERRIVGLISEEELDKSIRQFSEEG